MSNIASPAIFEVFVVFEHPDGRTLGASVARMHPDMVADLVVFQGDKYPMNAPELETGGTAVYHRVAYRERKEGEAPTPGTWHY